MSNVKIGEDIVYRLLTFLYVCCWLSGFYFATISSEPFYSMSGTIRLLLLLYQRALLNELLCQLKR